MNGIRRSEEPSITRSSKRGRKTRNEKLVADNRQLPAVDTFLSNRSSSESHVIPVQSSPTCDEGNVQKCPIVFYPILAENQQYGLNKDTVILQTLTSHDQLNVTDTDAVTDSPQPHHPSAFADCGNLPVDHLLDGNDNHRFLHEVTVTDDAQSTPPLNASSSASAD
jgi:hypothetical protein